MDGIQVPQGYSHFEEDPPSGFERKAPWMEIRSFNH